MTLEEAIEILENERYQRHSYATDQIGKAESLGIEALKARKVRKDNEGFDIDEALLGETED